VTNCRGTGATKAIQILWENFWVRPEEHLGMAKRFFGLDIHVEHFKTPPFLLLAATCNTHLCKKSFNAST
jgi:hypothetical protein